ncbi:hypothetical protein, partial [uncultured Methanobrevibacter sp.]|uniref:hypothetical protein n=1 Tax=uncultured Methanobrevibacter sp. TaxID=253161 RepID=UPI0025FD8BBD
MKINKSILVSILLLTILFMGAVSAAEEYNVAATGVVADTGDYKVDFPVTDEICAGGDVNSSDTSSVDVSGQENIAIGNDVMSVENSKEKLGVSNDEDVLGVDYDYILTPQGYKDHGFDSTLPNGSYKFEGTFRADDGFWSFISFDEGCIVDGSEAEFVDMGIILNGNCQITGLTITSTKYLEDDDFKLSPGAIVYVTGEGNILDGITVNYAPAADGDAYGIYAINANNFQLLNSNITFTGSSLEEYYEYAMRMETCDDVLVQANTITANLPILNVDYNKGDPGLATDLVLNTGIRDVTNLNIINNTFIANVVDRNGDYPTLDCVMVESCGYVNVTNNKFRETDFITNEGEANYLNVLDMYYSSNVLVNGNDISVETTGGSENAGTSYPIQLTGPYENVLIDGNDLYANCGGPALGIFSQNYYGGTEITVQNNNIDVTGLPTDHNWGLVSGIELQDNVARVYNNTITTKSITGSYEDGMNIYGISYVQALNEDHNYDIRGNVIETEGKYAIYLLKAQDTTITDNYLVSSVAEGDEAVYIRDASGDTVIENNHGAKENNVVTQDNFYDFFNGEGYLLDSVEFDELIFQGEFEDLVDFITIERPLTITGDKATLNNIGFVIQGDDCTLNNLKFVADTNLGSLILVDGVYGATLSNLDIFYDGGDESAIAVNVEGDGAQILNNTIFFESHVPDDTEFAVGLKLTGCTDILVDGNDITTKLPCVYCNNYDEDYYMMGSDKVDPVRLKDCTNLVFTNNYINSTTNNYSAEFPTIQSIQIIGCKNSILDHNIISMIDEMTPAGMDNYLYGINFGYNRNVTFSNNNFNMSTLGGKDAAGTAYAFQGVESEVNIIGNNITSISNGPNLGIYVASMFGGDSDLIIEDNFINVTGSASSTGSWALVSGIEIQNGDAKIYNNTVYTYNVNDYDDYAYMYGISYAQWMYGERSFDIQDNIVYTEGKYAISVINATSLNAERNTLYAHELSGDDSVNPGSCADVNIKDNLPKKINNIVTNDTFYNFFDEFGNLLDSVEFNELIFQGDFADLVSYITIDRALSITGGDAVLNDIAFVIAGSGVTLDNMTLVANSNL